MNGPLDAATLNQLHNSFRGGAIAQTSPQKTTKKKGNLLTNSLASIGGAGGGIGGAAGGAALGTMLLPGVGTVAGGLLGALLGGAAGGAAGTVGENALEGNTLGDNVAKNAAIEGVLSAGPLRLLKTGAKVGKAAATGGSLPDALVSGVGKVGKTAPVTAPASTNIKRTSAANRSAEGFGVKIGANAGGGKVVNADDADKLTDFITNKSQAYGGIRAGKPIEQARDAQNVYNNVVKQLDDSLANINRPLKPKEIQALTKSIDQKLIDDPNITGNTALADKFKSLVAKRDIKGLEKLRREYDDTAFTAAGKAGNTAKAAEAKALRDTIDEFVTPLSKDYKAVKGDYSLAKNARDTVSKANKDPMGIPLPVPSTGLRTISVGGQGVQGIKNKINAKLAGSSQNVQTGQGTAKNGLGKLPIATRTMLGTPLVNALSGQPQEAQAQDPLALQDELLGAGNSGLADALGGAGDLEQQTDTNPFSPANAEAAIQQILAGGGTMKDVKEYVGIVQAMQSLQPTAAKPLSAAAQKQQGTAQAGVNSLAEIETIIANGGVPKGTVVAGRGLLGGLGQNVLGTAAYDAAADNVADTMVRMRTGAAATKEELALYRRLLPQAFDSPEVIQQKLAAVRNYLGGLSSSQASPDADMQELMAGSAF